MRVLVTGARGFVGRTVVPILTASGCDVIPTYRTASSSDDDGATEGAARLEIDGSTDWRPYLTNLDTVIHLAGLAHSTAETSDISLYRAINVEGTRNLAHQAAKCGVRRLIFLSSIKVNGDSTTDRPFRADDRPNPIGSYAVSKYEAEAALQAVAAESDLEIVIIRSPLVYGPGLKGNLASLKKLIDRGFPIPTGAIENQRDLISVFNLCDLIRVCITHTDAPGRTFLASDGDAVSTNELIRYMAASTGKGARIWPLPIWALRLAASLSGKSEQLAKLNSSLQIDSAETQSILNWHPPHSVAESFEMAFHEGGA